jgi:hypothetical protein
MVKVQGVTLPTSHSILFSNVLISSTIFSVYRRSHISSLFVLPLNVTDTDLRNPIWEELIWWDITIESWLVFQGSKACCMFHAGFSLLFNHEDGSNMLHYNESRFAIALYCRRQNPSKPQLWEAQIVITFLSQVLSTHVLLLYWSQNDNIYPSLYFQYIIFLRVSFNNSI